MMSLFVVVACWDNEAMKPCARVGLFEKAGIFRISVPIRTPNCTHMRIEIIIELEICIENV